MTQSNDNEKQINGGQKNDSVTMLLKFNMHCDRCARKVVKFVSSLQGVDSVTRRENDWKKIMVVGKVDPVKLREIVEVKYNKNVELISPATKKHLDFVKDEINHKQFPVTTVVLKVSLNCGGCRGCIKKIQKLIEEAKGFVEMSIDKSNNLVMVKGAMDMNVLMMTLKKKLKRQIEIVQAKGGSGKKGKGAGVSEGPSLVGYNYRMEIYAGQGQYTYPQYINRPENTFNYMNATQMFNDENPNACVVM
ncbi:putative heavy metal-associated domain, HMA, heavy metal-associated domain superfamily [Helianthus annuus]|uniref:Heavy metal-associated domain, HMA, heavy metal-associated domain superfamily n=1 Tax=Helianthus annuus TaxID=4232 RepID=A0A251TQ84_HELAN|nr:putative heavy metal-associated domain, HMA, heavy metal-associated domain superfamily [Helianthus annuus]